MSTRFPFGRIRGTVAGIAVIAGAIAGVSLSQGSAAHAQVAAKVESQTRPNFGLLLDPPTRSYRNRGSHHRRYDYRRHRPD
jgi:transposase InsO family protein